MCVRAYSVFLLLFLSLKCDGQGIQIAGCRDGLQMEVSSEQLCGPPTAGGPSWGLGAGLTTAYVRCEHVICYAVLTLNMIGRGLRCCEHGNEPSCSINTDNL